MIPELTKRTPLTNSIDQGPVRIFAVIVLYKMRPDESTALRTLRAAIPSLQNGQAEIRILLYDNTLGGQDPGPLPREVQYYADLANSGLASAYNYALEVAKEGGFDWLLTLDQDTHLPCDFLRNLHHAISFVAPLTNVGAIVPTCGGGPGSPWTRRRYGFRPKRFSDDFIGIPTEVVYAVNSASTIRVRALQVIGGYDPRFPIWASDHVMFHRLQHNNFRVFVAGNIHVDHDSSMLDLKHRSTPDRYEAILRADEAFYDEYLGRQGHLVLLVLMLHRLVYALWVTGGSFSYFAIAVRFFCRGLFYSRKHRMGSWAHSD